MKIKNDGLAHLKELNRLSSLILDGTDISDEGLDHLAKLKTLQAANDDDPPPKNR